MSGGRHRARDRARGPGADLRGVPADRGRRRAARGDGARARPLEAARRAPRRPDLGRERARAVAAALSSRCRIRLSSDDPRSRSSIVEDNERNMKLFRDLLQVHGYETLEATSAEDALELAAVELRCARAHGCPASRPRRSRGAGAVACRSRHCEHPGARRDRPGDARGFGAVPRGRVRRLPRRNRSISTSSFVSSSSIAGRSGDLVELPTPSTMAWIRAGATLAAWPRRRHFRAASSCR